MYMEGLATDLPLEPLQEAPILRLGFSEIFHLSQFLDLRSLMNLYAVGCTSLWTLIERHTLMARFTPSHYFYRPILTVNPFPFLSRFPHLQKVVLHNASFFKILKSINHPASSSSSNSIFSFLPPTIEHLEFVTVRDHNFKARYGNLLSSINFASAFPRLHTLKLSFHNSDLNSAFLRTLPPSLTVLCLAGIVAHSSDIWTYVLGIHSLADGSTWPFASDRIDQIWRDVPPITLRTLPFPNLVAIEVNNDEDQFNMDLDALPPSLTHFGLIGDSLNVSQKLPPFWHLDQAMADYEAHLAASLLHDARVNGKALQTNISRSIASSSTSASHTGLIASSTTHDAFSATNMTSSTRSSGSMDVTPSLRLRSFHLTHEFLTDDFLSKLAEKAKNLTSLSFSYSIRPESAHLVPITPFLQILELSNITVDYATPQAYHSLFDDLIKSGTRLKHLCLHSIILPGEQVDHKLKQTIMDAMASITSLRLDWPHIHHAWILPSGLKHFKTESHDDLGWNGDSWTNPFPQSLETFCAPSLRFELGYVPLLPRTLRDLVFRPVNDQRIGTKFVTPEIQHEQGRDLPYHIINGGSNLLFGLPPHLTRLTLCSGRNFDYDCQLGLFLPRSLTHLSASWGIYVNIKAGASIPYALMSWIGLDEAQPTDETLLNRAVSFFPPGCACAVTFVKPFYLSTEIVKYPGNPQTNTISRHVRFM